MEKDIHTGKLACPDSVDRAKETLEPEREIVVIVNNDTAAAMAGTKRRVVL